MVKIQIKFFLTFRFMNKWALQHFILIESNSTAPTIQTFWFLLFFLIKLWKGPAMQNLLFKLSNIPRFWPKFLAGFLYFWGFSASFSDPRCIFQALLTFIKCWYQSFSSARFVELCCIFCRTNLCFSCLFSHTKRLINLYQSCNPHDFYAGLQSSLVTP